MLYLNISQNNKTEDIRVGMHGVFELRFWDKVKGFMFDPTETFNGVKDEDWGNSLNHYAKSLVIYALLQTAIFVSGFVVLMSFIVAFVPFPVPFLEIFAGPFAILWFILIILGGLFSILPSSLWMHIWIYVVGGRKGVGQTVKSLAYGSTPSLLLSWIPLVGIIFQIWSMGVSIIGIRQLHEISTERAIFAFIFGAIIVPATILVAVYLVVLYAGLLAGLHSLV